MRTYQTLTLIGSILGIFIMLALLIIMGFLGGALTSLQDLSEELNPDDPRAEERRQELATMEEENAPFIAGVALSFVIYLALIPIAFGNSKVAGGLILLLGLITVPITNYYGIIPFALLLPAGILALRYKKIKPTSATSTTEEGE